jgi:hypothetical protein
MPAFNIPTASSAPNPAAANIPGDTDILN